MHTAAKNTCKPR